MTRRPELPTGNSAEHGSFLVAAVVMILLLTALGLSVAGLVGLQYEHTKRQIFVENAQLVAEAGIEQSVHQLNTNDSFAGYSTAQQYFDNTSQGKGTFETTITNNSDGKSKTIIAIGNVYRSDSSTSPYITRKIKVTVVGTSSSGYSVLSGPGGLVLGGSANITNSDVYVGGTLTLNGASKIGTSDNPVQIDVGNNACPGGSNPGPTYPQVCTDGSQPITLAPSTRIYGTVCATGQTSTGPNNNIQTGNGGAGLKVGCTAPVASPPTYDRAAQVSAVTTTAPSSTSAYKCSGNKTINWPANLELTGDVAVGNSCQLTINGNVYVTGNLTVGGAAQIKVADSLGSTRPVVIVDGTITVGGSASMVANSTGTGIEFISFKNATGDPAATMTGTNLKTSQGIQTISVGGSVNLPGVVFDSYWGTVSLSGSGSMGAATGQTVDLSGAGTIIFGTSLSSGSKTWDITSYQRLY